MTRTRDERATDIRDAIELLYWARADLRDAETLLGLGVWRLAVLRMKTALLFIEPAILTLHDQVAG